MNGVFSPERIGKTKNDIVFLVVLFMLIGLGLCALLSASHTTSENLFQNSSKIIVKQIISALIAFILCIVVSRIPFKWIQKSIPLIVGASLILCVVVLIMGKKS
jgi:cell division protein FtsW (lipid II flippase)